LIGLTLQIKRLVLAISAFWSRWPVEQEHFKGGAISQSCTRSNCKFYSAVLFQLACVARAVTNCILGRSNILREFASFANRDPRNSTRSLSRAFQARQIHIFSPHGNRFIQNTQTQRLAVSSPTGFLPHPTRRLGIVAVRGFQARQDFSGFGELSICWVRGAGPQVCLGPVP